MNPRDGPSRYVVIEPVGAGRLSLLGFYFWGAAKWEDRDMSRARGVQTVIKYRIPIGRVTFAATLVLLVGAGERIANADTLLIPSQYPTIQAAINDSNDRDIIIVADGTYTGDGNRHIDFKGKSITLQSENGPENCTIDCNGTEDEPRYSQMLWMRFFPAR